MCSKLAQITAGADAGAWSCADAFDQHGTNRVMFPTLAPRSAVFRNVSPACVPLPAGKPDSFDDLAKEFAADTEAACQNLHA